MITQQPYWGNVSAVHQTGGSQNTSLVSVCPSFIRTSNDASFKITMVIRRKPVHQIKSNPNRIKNIPNRIKNIPNGKILVQFYSSNIHESIKDPKTRP